MYKKLFLIILSSTLLFNLTACGESESEKKAKESKEKLLGKRP